MLRKLIKNGLLLLNSVLVLLTFIAFLSRFVSVQEAWFVSVLGLLLPWFFFANLLFIGFWLWRRKKFIFLSLATLLIGWKHFQSFINISIPETPTEKSMTLMTYNLARLGTFNKLKLGKTFVQSFAEALPPKSSLDFLCLQEVPNSEIALLKKQFGLTHAYLGDNRGLAILSRYPINQGQQVPLKSQGNGAIWAIIATPSGPIKIYNVHLESNKITQKADELAEKMDLEDRKTYSTIKFMLRNYKNAAIKREQQAKVLLGQIKKDDLPVLIAGDFNETPQSLVYGYFSSQFQDGFVQKGKGLGTTFNGSIPLLRIDHIFGDSDIHFENYKTLAWDFSDHFPVLANFQVTKS